MNRLLLLVMNYLSLKFYCLSLGAKVVCNNSSKIQHHFSLDTLLNKIYEIKYMDSIISCQNKHKLYIWEEYRSLKK